ncbi:DoxX family protein [Polyangium aurulentum]|nr:DoxX family protein [Polyangium aurulentum]UQA57746.1 DoxX family protein [Polyangium aurulentum]
MNLVSFFRTDRSSVNLALRVTLGLVMFPHGAQKLLGWFGGPGFSGTMGFFTSQAGVPAPIAFLVIMAESIGALMLIVGAGTRLAAVGIFSVMVGAVAMQHWQHGFFMNWFGNKAGEGFEYHLLVLAIAGVLAVVGAGRLSVDAWIADKLGGKGATVRSIVRPVPSRKAA